MIKVDGGAAAEEFAPGSDIDIERISFHPEQRTDERTNEDRVAKEH